MEAGHTPPRVPWDPLLRRSPGGTRRAAPGLDPPINAMKHALQRPTTIVALALLAAAPSLASTAQERRAVSLEVVR